MSDSKDSSDIFGPSQFEAKPGHAGSEPIIVPSGHGRARADVTLDPESVLSEADCVAACVDARTKGANGMALAVRDATLARIRDLGWEPRRTIPEIRKFEREEGRKEGRALAIKEDRSIETVSALQASRLHYATKVQELETELTKARAALALNAVGHALASDECTRQHDAAIAEGRAAEREAIFAKMRSDEAIRVMARVYHDAATLSWDGRVTGAEAVVRALIAHLSAEPAHLAG